LQHYFSVCKTVCVVATLMEVNASGAEVEEKCKKEKRDLGGAIGF
jgi:hypothetical protein